jgi:chemotaxis response regulator CheB
MLAIVADNPKKHCVLIIGDELLLGAGVERLLSAEASLYVVGAAAPNGATLLEIVKHLQPDTLVLNETYFLGLSLEHVIELLAYLQLQVIAVSANHDRVQIYYQQQLQICRTTDPVHLIRDSKKMVTWYAKPTYASRPKLNQTQCEQGVTLC